MITRWPCRVPSRPTSKITTYGWSTRREIPATGKPYVLPFVAMYTVRDGLIVSSRSYWDGIESLDQLG